MIPAAEFPRIREKRKEWNVSDTEKRTLDSSQWTLIFVIVAVAAGSVMYRLIVMNKLEQTSALFIGIPAALAIWLALTPKADSAKGGIVKGLTLALLLSGVLLGEGFICIVMASPVFYLVGICVGALVDWNREKSKTTTLSCLFLLLLPMSLEGITPGVSFNREETVQVSQVVAASASDVERALSRGPRTDLPLPLYLRMGFPRPTQAAGSGLEVGATRTIHFAGGEGHPGDLVLRVAESRPGYVRFEAVSDKSKIAHWLDWQSSETEWTPVDVQHTRVSWTLHFERRLDPAWYFGPWERYGTVLAARYLIGANATPTSDERGR
jgi:hypothetical protein